jgi:GNAT superfamily N-acetyltransferase
VVLRVLHRPPLTDRLRAELVEVWVAATNAGGALGLTAPTDAAAAEQLAQPLWQRLGAGIDELVVGRLPEPGDEGAGRLAGWYVLERREGPLSPHWRTLKRLQIHPAHQGQGHGSALLNSADDVARRLGLEALHLTVRGGTGTERFYLARGYREVGRIPRALRLTADDVRDEIHLHKDLRAPRPGERSPGG